MGIGLPGEIGWHIHRTEQAARLFRGQLPFSGDVHEGLDGAGTEALRFDGIFEVLVARLLEGAPFFAVLFVTMLVATHLVVTYLGKAGVYSLAALMGVTDVDPFIMGMTQAGGSSAPLSVAAAAIQIGRAHV